MPFKVGVLGAGAVGAYVGGPIALRTKSDVVMVGRRRFVDQVSAGGGPSALIEEAARRAQHPRDARDR